MVAATRAIPLVMKRTPIERTASLASHDKGTILVKPLKKLKTGLIILGNEVYEGLIEDGFAPLLPMKIDDFGSMIFSVEYTPDNSHYIQQAFERCTESGLN